ncbi:MAG TPA: tyrosine-type recombinase/integrase, partial [Bdellovibrio sp.]|nr:tyrosine-type recombinase/integrase [Bdellovibrio sp.]
SFEEFVFGEEALSQRRAYEMVRQSGVRAGLLKPLHPHALRHSFATHLLSSGANLRTLQELLGHESLQATEKYTHLGIDQLARTMEQLHPLGKGK